MKYYYWNDRESMSSMKEVIYSLSKCMKRKKPKKENNGMKRKWKWKCDNDNEKMWREYVINEASNM